MLLHAALQSCTLMLWSQVHDPEEAAAIYINSPDAVQAYDETVDSETDPVQ
jgi:hypothetical protein